MCNDVKHLDPHQVRTSSGAADASSEQHRPAAAVARQQRTAAGHVDSQEVSPKGQQNPRFVHALSYMYSVMKPRIWSNQLVALITYTIMYVYL